MLFGKKKQFAEQPLGYWEEASCFMVIPDEGSGLKSPDELVEAVKGIEGAEVKYSRFDDEKGELTITCGYCGEEYKAVFTVSGFSLPESYLYTMKAFTPEETEKLKNAQRSLNIMMKIDGKPPKTAFHFQIKLAAACVPDLIGLVDESAEHVFPPKWAKLAAKSKVTPGPQDMFYVHAVSAENGEVWLHTHGLCRFGLTEVEILNSDSKNFRGHYNLLSAYASYLCDMNEGFDAHKDIAYIGVLRGNIPVVAICKSWTEALGEYKKLGLGGEADRKESHNTRTSPMFLYKTEDDMKKGKLSKVSDYNALWEENPIYFISNEETARMKALAAERFDYVKRAFENPDNKILIKVGLVTDNKKENGEDDFEHIWFELIGFNGEKFRGKLTQEPYQVSSMHKDDEGEYTVEQITDWIIFTNEHAVKPNDVYLLEG